MKNYRILVVDDHQIVRDGIRGIFRIENPEYEILESSSIEESWEIIQAEQPDLVIFDLVFHHRKCFDSIERTRTSFPSLSILIFSEFGNIEDIQRANKAGVKGYLLKKDLSIEILKAVEVMRKGGYYYSESIKPLLPIVQESVMGNEPINILSAREKEVFEWLSYGKTRKEIAANLGISWNTVTSHLKNICEKLNIEDIHKLTYFAAQYYNSRRLKNED